MNEAEKLKKKIKELEEALEKERCEKEKITREKEKIEKEFEEFKAKHKQTVAELRKALKIKASKKVQLKPVGAKKGHKAYTRRIPERIDKVRALNPKKCPHCNSILSETQEIRQRHVTDIKLTSKVINTKYNIHRKYCRKCKKIVEPDVPNVLPHARFGLNLMLLIMYLRLGLRLPGNKVCEFLMSMYDLTISEGEIVHVLKQLVVAFGDYYQHLEKLVKMARVKHTDSTSWRVNSRNYYAWVFVAAGVVLYKIRKRNNSKVPLTVFGTQQKGMTLVIDRHSALRALAEKAKFMLQFCWSHILDDSKELAKNFGAEGRYVHKKLKQVYEYAISFEGNGLPEQVEALKAEIFLLTQRHYKSTTVRKFVNTLWKRDIENLFRFVTDPEIDPTNNISERELRHLVIIRKISNGSRSSRGANATAMLLSVIQTLRMNKKNVLEGLKEIINNPTPSGY
jgi:transposase